MQSPAWVALFRHIPVNLHDSIALVMNTGAEIVVGKILRLERDFMIVRGRMSGTMDGGRVMIVPYDLISNLAFNRKMTEQEVQDIFSKFRSPATMESQVIMQAASGQPEVASEDFGPVDSRPEEEKTVESVEAEAGEEKVEETPGGAILQEPEVKEPEVKKDGPSSPPAGKPPLPSKSILLARLRARLAGETNK